MKEDESALLVYRLISLLVAQCIQIIELVILMFIGLRGEAKKVRFQWKKNKNKMSASAP